MPRLRQFVMISTASFCCCSLVRPGFEGQSMLLTVATQTPRNSCFGCEKAYPQTKITKAERKNCFIVALNLNRAKLFNQKHEINLLCNAGTRVINMCILALCDLTAIMKQQLLFFPLYVNDFIYRKPDSKTTTGNKFYHTDILYFKNTNSSITGTAFTFYLQIDLSFLTKANRENKKEYICSRNESQFFQ